MRVPRLGKLRKLFNEMGLHNSLLSGGNKVCIILSLSVLLPSLLYIVRECNQSNKSEGIGQIEKLKLGQNQNWTT